MEVGAAGGDGAGGGQRAAGQRAGRPEALAEEDVAAVQADDEGRLMGAHDARDEGCARDQPMGVHGVIALLAQPRPHLPAQGEGGQRREQPYLRPHLHVRLQALGVSPARPRRSGWWGSTTSTAWPRAATTRAIDSTKGAVTSPGNFGYDEVTISTFTAS